MSNQLCIPSLIDSKSDNIGRTKELLPFSFTISVQNSLVGGHCIPKCLDEDACPGHPVTGETDRPLKRRSMEGRRGLRRLTGQNAEPP